MIRLLTAFFFLFASALASENWPAWQSTTVNDFAEVMDEASEARVTAQLDSLRKETGIEFAVLTLRTQAEFTPEMTLEAFAQGVFDHWGIGDKERNDGILALVLVDDREMRIELGLGYAGQWDRAAERVVDDFFLPDFRRGDYQAGIEAGVQEAIASIALPFADRADPPSAAWADKAPPYSVMLGMLAFIFRRFLSDQAARLRKCPSCGRCGLRVRRETIKAASRSATGQGERTTYCPHCDWRDRDTFVIPSQRSSSSNGFGGGRSGGGGASGRW